METDPDPNYDSDDSLPDVEELCSSQPTEIKEGDIVWAKYRNYYWPSLIRKVFKKERKVSLWYLDSPKKCFKVSLKNIHSFTDRSFCQEVRRAVSDSPLKTLHEKVLDSTLCFLQRKGQGIKDDPGAYFDRSMHYLSLCDLKSSTIKPNDLKSQLACESLQTSLTRESLKTSLEGCYKNDSEEESISDSDDEEEKFDKLRDELVIKEEEYCPEDKVDAIVACITAGKVNKYLIDVTAHKVPSQRQDIFDEYIRTGNGKLLLHGSFGIFIKDFSKLRRICDYLQNFYESVAEKGKWDIFKYVTSVWLPDALTKALSLVEGVSEDTSESVGAKRKLFSSVEKESQGDIEDISSLNSPKLKNISPKKRKLNTQKIKRTSPRKQSSDNAVLIENCVKPVEKSRSIKAINSQKSENKSPKNRKLDSPEKKRTSPGKQSGGNSENSTVPEPKLNQTRSPKRITPPKKTPIKQSSKKLPSNDSEIDNDSQTVARFSKKNPKSPKKNASLEKNCLHSRFVEGSVTKIIITNGSSSKNKASWLVKEKDNEDLTVSKPVCGPKTVKSPKKIVNIEPSGRTLRGRPSTSN